MRASTLFLIFLSLIIRLPAQEISLFDYLSAFDSIEVKITTDFKELLKKKDEYQAASIMIHAGDSVLLDTIGEIRSRGNIRKKVCFMPPTKIRLTKKYLKNRGFSTYPTLKIVNACSFSNSNTIYIQKEKLIYEIYNAVTDRSYRTKSIIVTYEDSEGKKSSETVQAFFIEHEDQLAERLGGELYDVGYFKPEALERKTYVLFCVFQYMVGNTDWKVLNRHNMTIIKLPEERIIFPVAYDFDYAGLINTHYAVPHSSLSIKEVSERLYLGPCQTDDEITAMCQYFLSKKDMIHQLIDDSGLSDRDIKQCRSYLDKFFEMLEDKREASFVFSNCIDY